MKKYLLLFLLFYVVANAQGQRRGIYGAKKEKLVDFTGHNRLHGFHFAPGITYSFPPFKKINKEYFRSGDTVGNLNLKGKGKFGLYFEAGMYHLLPYSRIFKYLDWSIAYKALKAQQDYNYSTSIESTNTNLTNGKGTNAFKYRFLTANLNLNNIWQIANYSFIQNSIGLDYNYALFGKKEVYNSAFVNPSTFGKSVFSLHYKLGFGYKLNKFWFIIPTLETPILNFIKFENFKSSLNVFDMRYRPIILSIRIAWLRRPRANECPPLPGTEGDKDRQDKYQMQGR